MSRLGLEAQHNAQSPTSALHSRTTAKQSFFFGSQFFPGHIRHQRCVSRGQLAAERDPCPSGMNVRSGFRAAICHVRQHFFICNGSGWVWIPGATFCLLHHQCAVQNTRKDPWTSEQTPPALISTFLHTYQLHEQVEKDGI